MFNLRFKDLFDMGSAVVTPDYTLAEVTVNTLVALITGLVIYGIYKKTYQGVLFSKNMGISIVMVSAITSLIVVAISGNLALSLGMIGALSIVRFRTPVKDPRDLTFLFWSVANGVICGIAAYKLAVMSMIVLGVTILFLSRHVTWQTPYLLVVHVSKSFPKELTRILAHSCRKYKERSSTTLPDRIEVIYEILLKKTGTLELLHQIQALPEVTKAITVSYDGELDETR